MREPLIILIIIQILYASITNISYSGVEHRKKKTYVHIQPTIENGGKIQIHMMWNKLSVNIYTAINTVNKP